MIIVKECTTKNEVIDSFIVRKKVFIEEQSIPQEMEFDLLEKECVMFNLYIDGLCVVTARMYKVDDYYKIQRVCTLKEYRRQNLASILMNYIIDNYQDKCIGFMLTAQLPAISFYEKLGFKVISDIFIEAGVEHKKMEKRTNI